MTKKLYRVTCRGMTYGEHPHGIAYVVADDPDQAYKRLRAALDDGSFGFEKERELDKIELLAEARAYPDCGIILYP